MIVKDNSADFESVPLGVHRAICANYYNLGLQPGYQGGKPCHKVALLWELEPRRKDGSRHQITKIFTAGIGKKSNLGGLLESWRGRAFTDDERKGFDLEKVVNVPCILSIIPNEDRAKIGAIMPGRKGEPYWPLETKRDYIPAFVEKMIAEALPDEPSEEKPLPFTPFTDDIPF